MFECLGGHVSTWSHRVTFGVGHVNIFCLLLFVVVVLVLIVVVVVDIIVVIVVDINGKFVIGEERTY